MVTCWTTGVTRSKKSLRLCIVSHRATLTAMKHFCFRQFGACFVWWWHQNFRQLFTCFHNKQKTRGFKFRRKKLDFVFFCLFLLDAVSPRPIGSHQIKEMHRMSDKTNAKRHHRLGALVLAGNSQSVVAPNGLIREKILQQSATPAPHSQASCWY